MTLLRGLVVQSEVIFALVLRETRTRFGGYRMGYLWALLEPALMILTFFVLFRIGKHGAPPGMDLFDFIATGIIPYNLFTNTVGKVSDSISGNKALLFYPQVLPIDLAIARGLLELVTHLGVFLVLMGVHAIVVQDLTVDQPLLVIVGLVLAGLLGGVVGLVFSGLGQLTTVMDRIRGPLLRPLFWVSGIFFTAASLPDRVRDGMLWNPVLHCNELVRGGWFASYDELASIGFVVRWVIVLALVGLALERVVRSRIELT
jgi:capsular polysaccharide transport system permease protein